MKVKNYLKKGSRTARSFYNLIGKSLILSALILTGSFAPAQELENQFTEPSWWFGAAAGANVNFYRGSTQELNSDFKALAAFHDGFGVGLYLAPLIEFHRPDSRWGIMLQAGYDSRKGSFDRVVTPCNCPADLTTDLSYITVEPSLRLAPFKSNLYLYIGPRFAFNRTNSFTYSQEINPNYPDQVANPDVEGDFSKIKTNLISFQIGAGYDISLSSKDKHTQFMLSPFASFQPYFGQEPRSIETWNITTLRVGASLKFGRGHENTKEVDAAAFDSSLAPKKVVILQAEPDVQFSIISPKNIPLEKRVRETFPIRNYIFFDLGSSQIPERYVLITQDEVKNFKEDQLEVLEPKRLDGRSAREMVVYYNILNILGDRMNKNPSATINLVGSSRQGPKDGKEMAASVKLYLVMVFGIDGSRITIEGRIKPKFPSEKSTSTQDLKLLREGDRRVSIESTSPALLMEFQSGPDAPLKPVEFNVMEVAPTDSYVTFIVEGSIVAFSSWSLQILDKNGVVQNFGPYTKDKVSMPGKLILGTLPDADYNVTMIGTTKNGKTVKMAAPLHLVLWTAPKREEGKRYSIIYGINESKAIKIYQKYLVEVVIPKIPNGSKVSIDGFTDIIGDEDYNQKLSLARANDVKNILEEGLVKAGRTDVIFDVYGLGEDPYFTPFSNDFPEGRFYNRSVIININPPE